MTDFLREASQALREFDGANKNSNSATRARVLMSLQRTKKSRRRSLVAIPLAALLMGSFALAATTGRLPVPVQKWFSALTSPRPSEPPRRERRLVQVPSARLPEGTASADAPVATTSPAASVEPPSAVPPQAEPRNTGTVALRVAPGQVRESTQRASPEEKPMTEEEYERYRTAHEAHFVRKDPAAALAAWSEYLAHSPSGRLAVEARYNRALCLMKLGRTREAITALRPFTQGSHGAYRQKEALQLIAQLETDAGAQHSHEGRY